MDELDKMKTGLEAIQSPRLHSLIHYWNDKRCGRRMPSRKEIDPVEIPRLLPIVLLADMVEAQPHIRLLGTEATAAYGAEMRGRHIVDFNFGEFSPQWIEAFSLVTTTLSPATAEGHYTRNDTLLRIEALLLPLSDDDRTISHILGGLLIKPVPYVAAKRPAPSVTRLLKIPTQSIFASDGKLSGLFGRPGRGRHG